MESFAAEYAMTYNTVRAKIVNERAKRKKRVKKRRQEMGLDEENWFCTIGWKGPKTKCLLYNLYWDFQFMLKFCVGNDFGTVFSYF